VLEKREGGLLGVWVREAATGGVADKKGESGLKRRKFRDETRKNKGKAPLKTRQQGVTKLEKPARKGQKLLKKTYSLSQKNRKGKSVTTNQNGKLSGVANHRGERRGGHPTSLWDARTKPNGVS